MLNKFSISHKSTGNIIQDGMSMIECLDKAISLITHGHEINQFRATKCGFRVYYHLAHLANECERRGLMEA